MNAKNNAQAADYFQYWKILQFNSSRFLTTGLLIYYGYCRILYHSGMEKERNLCIFKQPCRHLAGL